MNKLFTGLAIGQLVEQGKLSYDDPLGEVPPGFSGSGEREEDPDQASAESYLRAWRLLWDSGLPRRVGPYVHRQGPRRHIREEAARVRARDEMAYSNIGFVLLGRIIEIVTGQDYSDYMQKNVFAPAGATSASFPLLPKNGVAVVPMAYPYESVWDAEARMSIENQLGKYRRRGSPAGNGVASALDVLKLSNAMNAGRIAKPETFRFIPARSPSLARRITAMASASSARHGTAVLSSATAVIPRVCAPNSES